jgi:hypothetical protein
MPDIVLSALIPITGVFRMANKMVLWLWLIQINQATEHPGLALMRETTIKYTSGAA